MLHLQLTPQEVTNSLNFLNDRAIHLKGDNLSFFVHYWGTDIDHYDNPLHKHSFFEVCYIMDGEGLYRDGDDEYPLRSGVMFISRPNIRHQILSQKGLYIVFVAFEVVEQESSPEFVELFRHFAVSSRVYIPDAHDLPEAMLWRSLMIQAARNRPAFAECVVPLAYSLLVSFEGLFHERSRKSRIRRDRPSSTTLYRAKLFIRDNLSHSLKLREVANYLHISERHLSRLFSTELGKTFFCYVRKERIKRAIHLLSNTDYSIKRVAQETGFESVHYFTKVFKAETGITPGKFVRRIKSGEIGSLPDEYAADA